MTQAMTSNTISGYTVIQLVESIMSILSILKFQLTTSDQGNLEAATCSNKLATETSITSVKGLGYKPM